MTQLRCKHNGEPPKAPYHYTECGLDDVYLVSGYNVEETEYGPVVTVRDADDLLRTIGVFLATEKKILSGKELRFLRTQMNYSQGDLGKLIGVTDQTVARWEKEQVETTTPADYLIRLLYLDSVKERTGARKVLQGLENKDADIVDGMQLFERIDDDWRPRLAA